MPKTPQHTDVINSILSIGDPVAFSTHNTLHVGFVKKISTVKITITPLITPPASNRKPKHPPSSKPVLRYPKDVAKLNPLSFTTFLLTYQKPS